MTHATGKLWPNGEFGFTTTRRFNPSPLPKRKSTEDSRWKAAALSVHGLSEVIRAYAPTGQTAEFLSVGTQGEVEAPLGLSEVPNSHKTPRGRQGLTSYGGRMLRNGAFLLQKEFGKDRLSFLTLTLPNLHDEDWEPVVKNWSAIMKVFLQWLRRKQESAGLKALFVSCNEIQPGRFSRTGKTALHAHIVFLGRRSKRGWIVTPKQVRAAWKRSVSRFLTASSDSYNWASTENLVRVRKNVEAYLSKYISKGVSGLAVVKSTLQAIPLPNSWWNCSMNIKKWIMNLRVPLRGHSIDWLIREGAVSRSSKVVFIRTVKVTLREWKNGKLYTWDIPVGAKGVLTQEGVRLVRMMSQGQMTALSVACRGSG